jgi:hypothetical protein
MSQHILSAFIHAPDKIAEPQPKARGLRIPAKDGERHCAHLRHKLLRAEVDSMPDEGTIDKEQ